MVKQVQRFINSCPHSCGGEPVVVVVVDILLGVVPTHVGVNLRHAACYYVAIGCPHSCGGEPHLPSFRQLSVAVVPTHVGVNRVE